MLKPIFGPYRPPNTLGTIGSNPLGSHAASIDIRYRPRFFDQVGYQTMYAFIGNTVAAHLRAAFDIFSLHENKGLFTVTFGDKVSTLAKSGYGI